MPLRPLNPESGQPKTDDELTEGERRSLERESREEADIVAAREARRASGGFSSLPLNVRPASQRSR